MHLFGNEQGASSDFRQGALVFYSTPFSCLGFEVINPHSRKTRAGKNPIFYEVVPRETTGLLRILYAPVPEAAGSQEVEQRETAESGRRTANDCRDPFSFEMTDQQIRRSRQVCKCLDLVLR